ncbi:MarR family winged helix-turn-helix transcriptional regulator [Bacillus sp. Cr_A10]|uniref:MarR family winged helix-turn-helix transcriptional regulator n=1 Tax=Bacillus sp. Cr_A10 TaxID=3033993 RepID=UPI0023DA75C4|nr:MarR family winged helix-turn-helix transcriptional regulator [Bacillus sp. Cr_A10]MDF2067455.1 MarR family winged helix-turn-helix transcriptional regulator [Bacillus sp. Cr_A10]
MNKNNLFHKFVAFTTSVHRVTHELTKNAKLDTITPVQYNILEYVYVSQPVTPSEISDCQYMSMPNTSRELKKLSEKNLINKFGDIEDRRKQYIRLSKEGETMMNSAFQLIESDFLKRIKDASKEDLEEIEKALDILHKKVFY